jgi:hypothetical protein
MNTEQLDISHLNQQEPATADPKPESWEAISAQLDYWADMDAKYWSQRKEKEYEAWWNRTYK